MQKEKKILIVVGTRPNFIKVTQFKKVASKYPNLNMKVVHTSQHYSDELSKLFFHELDLFPDYFLDIPNDLSTVSQMAEIMKGLENLINSEFYPDLLIVVGDVNSTLAGALVANKMNIPLAHIESGLRSFDNSMPEEYNRTLTDKITQYFFVTEETALNNLKYEGIPENKLFFVGNTMIDTLVAYKDKIEQSTIIEDLSISSKRYILLTMHRPGNVDEPSGLEKIIRVIETLHDNYSHIIKNIVFPIHPRTKNSFKKHSLWDKINALSYLKLIKPQSYLNFQKLINHAIIVITDSGGVQEETTYLNIPCITLRPTTERPCTMWKGSNILLPFNERIICEYIGSILNTPTKKSQIPPLWDGKATERIVDVLNTIL